MNHEYTDDGLLHAGGMQPGPRRRCARRRPRTAMSVIEVELAGGRWQMVRPSRYARRITATTPMRDRRPGAGHALMKTAADPAGTHGAGHARTTARSGMTPWGTYLSGEENFADYFARRRPADRARSGAGASRKDARLPLGTSTTRASTPTQHPNEPNRFGWVVEIDPMDPSAHAGQAHRARPRRARGRLGRA